MTLIGRAMISLSNSASQELGAVWKVLFVKQGGCCYISKQDYAHGKVTQIWTEIIRFHWLE